jgi:hypothetical protein
MKQLLPLLLCITILSCQKEKPDHSPTDASGIQGEWVELTGTLQPDWKYSFDDGLLTQSYEAFGSVLTTLTFPYATRQDTVFIGGDTNNQTRIWILYFECHEIVQVRDASSLLGQKFWLKRE